ncbi:MAG TPA: TolC family protein [Bacteroidales bacterium]|nr:TolC family protein [Bacteroidales bacterium]
MKTGKFKFKIIGKLALALGLFAPAGAYSQDSLMNYLAIAARNNPVVMQYYYEYQASLKKVPQAGALPDPTVNAGVFLSPMELISGNQVAEFQLMQMFPWFGTLKSAKDEMSLMAKAKYETMEDAKLQVFYDVQRTWYEIFKLKRQYNLAANNLDILKSIERIALIRYKTAGGSNTAQQVNPSQALPNTQSPGSSMQGMGSSASAPQAAESAAMQTGSMSGSSAVFSLADLYRVQTEIGELKNSMELIKNQQNVLLATFNSYLNRPVMTAVFVPDSVIADTIPVNLELIDDSMMVHNPMLRMLDYEQQSLEARKKMNTRMGYPMIGIGLNYSVIDKSAMSESEMNGKDMIMPMVNVSVPVYRKKYRSMREETELMASATGEKIRAAANDLQTQLYLAIQTYEDSQRRIAFYSDQIVLTRKSLNILMQSFATSGTGLTDVLRTRQQLLDYQFRHTSAMADLNTSVALLKRLSGV